MSVKNEEVKNEKTEEVKENNITQADVISESEKTGEVLKKEEKVQISIPVSELNPQDKIVQVGINGYIYQIKRGEEVEVPREVYRILRNAKYI